MGLLYSRRWAKTSRNPPARAFAEVLPREGSHAIRACSDARPISGRWNRRRFLEALQAEEI
jgi:hypothetical protein